MSFFGLNNSKTFKPKRNIPEGSKQAELKKFAEATLGSGNLKLAVELPQGEDLNEWLAVNTVDFSIRSTCSMEPLLSFALHKSAQSFQSLLDDDAIFPSKIGVPFSKSFQTSIKTILKRLFRVYAHIYHSHFQKFVDLRADAHLNTSFKHFIYFVNEFSLIDKKELAPLEDLIKTMMTQ
ncbi:hypothetical protein BASA61_002794 [Batrachochytrium salamandrivorans]|nr:hypothetical protein BASA61_002794 [Batrachochytrium salamandrivorans]